MKLGSCKHLDECKSKLPSVLNFDLFLRSSFSEHVKARAIKCGSDMHVEE